MLPEACSSAGDEQVLPMTRNRCSRPLSGVECARKRRRSGRRRIEAVKRYLSKVVKAVEERVVGWSMDGVGALRDVCCPPTTCTCSGVVVVLATALVSRTVQILCCSVKGSAIQREKNSVMYLRFGLAARTMQDPRGYWDASLVCVRSSRYVVDFHLDKYLKPSLFRLQWLRAQQKNSLCLYN